MLTTKNLEYKIFESEVNSVLSDIERTVVELEKIIRKNADDQKAEVLKEAKKIELAINNTESELEILEAEIYLDYLKKEYKSSRSYQYHMLFKSQFFLVFSYFESSLILLHKICSDDLKAYLPVSENNVDNMEKAKGFFVKTLGIDWIKLNNFWNELMVYKDFRNHFLHNSLIVSDPSIRGLVEINDYKYKKLCQHVKKILGISLNQDDEIYINHDDFIITDKIFITRLIDSKKEFFKHLVIDILDRKKSLTQK